MGFELGTEIAEAEVARETAPAGGSIAALWRNRDFKVILAGQGTSALGDAVTFTALPLLVLALTGSGVLMGVVGILQTLPDLVLGLVAGAYADRHDRRRIMFYSDLGRAVLTALIPISYWLGLPTMTVILLVTAPNNALRVFWLAGATAATPSLVGRDLVGRASGIMEAFFSFAFVIGPALAGILVGIIGPAPTLAVDAASFVGSAAALGLVRRPLQSETPRGDVHLVADVLEGLRYVVRHPTLRAIIGFWGAVSIVAGPIGTAVIFYLSLDRGFPPEVIGLTLSLFSVGYLAGSLVGGYATKGPVGPVMLAGSALEAFALLAFALGGPLPVLLLIASAAGLAEALILISYLTLRTTIPPDHLLGRVGSTARTVSVGLQPLGFLTVGILLDLFRGQATLLAMSATLLLISLAGAMSASLRAARVPER